MPVEAPPTVELLDDRYVELTAGVEVPARFRANFDGAVSISVEIEMVDGSPTVRSVTITSTTDGLAGKDLRQPLSSQLVPAAMAAAYREQPRPDPNDEVVRIAAWADLGVLSGHPSPMSDRFLMSSNGNNAAPATSRRGRPRRVSNHDELVHFANAYLERRSLSDVMARFPKISKTTAWRRVNEARDAGLIPDDT